ncbi:MAG: hypothetical protein KVP17_005218 [Porospora cf. gigantea B]|uniref:uncharacterized protein n=1 Tax=Porospora cf. gigantea B TaxID=2853592 RepID=UPI003571B95D|nr:MAG: hypothetical protein KVP17_005218 [Porospora cf. gigantea B]
MSLPWTLRWMQCIHDFWGMWPEEPVESDISFAEKSAMKGEASEACSKCLPHSPGLEVRQSTLPGAGLGLFTTRLYQDTDHICTYSGTVLSLRQFLLTTDKRYVMGGFGLNHHVDAKDHPEVLARYINDNRPDLRNCRMMKDVNLKQAKVIAIQEIPPGTELFASYGQRYWRATGAPWELSPLPLPPQY